MDTVFWLFVEMPKGLVSVSHDLGAPTKSNYVPSKQSHFKETHRLKVKRWKKISHVNGDQKGAEMATLGQNRL